MPVGAGIRVDISGSRRSNISALRFNDRQADRTWGRPRQSDRKDVNALSNLQIKGVPSTVDIHRRILTHPQFRSGQYDTTFLESAMDQMLGVEAQK